jgi:hypothetical protein
MKFLFASPCGAAEQNIIDFHGMPPPNLANDPGHRIRMATAISALPGCLYRPVERRRRRFE